VQALDAGAMFAKVTVPIGPEDTAEDVERSLAVEGGRVLVDVVGQIAKGTAREEPQDDSLATYAPKITRDEGIIDWSRPAATIHNQVRALTPWPRAWTHHADARVIIVRTQVETTDNGSPPGTVLEASGDRLVVQSGGSALRILSLQPEGRRVMTAREFLAGRPFAPGSRLA